MSDKSKSDKATGIPAGITAEAWNAMDEATKAAISAMAAKAERPATALSVVSYAACDKGGNTQDGKPKACRLEVGKATCPHGKGPNGKLGVTGLGRFPLTLYAGQWERFFDTVANTVKATAADYAKRGLGVK